MTTLADGTTTITVPDDLLWSDEFAWSPVEQTVERGLTGSSIVQVGTKTNGRPITLGADADNVGWVTRTTLDALYGFASVAGKVMTLTYRGTARQVIFRHQDNGAVEASPVIPYADVQPTDYYRVALRFTEV
jgi:hypothetical protein